MSYLANFEIWSAASESQKDPVRMFGSDGMRIRIRNAAAMFADNHIQGTDFFELVHVNF